MWSKTTLILHNLNINTTFTTFDTCTAIIDKHNKLQIEISKSDQRI